VYPRQEVSQAYALGPGPPGPVSVRLAAGARPLPPVPDQHRRGATYSCFAIEGATPPGFADYRNRYTALCFPRKATRVV
ncbi:MAG: hypothetical protein ACLQCU_06900, partial [Acidimicrobiales bacterium]